MTQKCLTSSTGQNTIDHIIKLDMAKEADKLQALRNESRGFCEVKNKGDPPPPQQAASWALDHLYLT